MNNENKGTIQQAFASANNRAFIPFITAGDPTLSVTKELLYAMAEAGASMIEIGIPFSDPVAEGSVIQEANERALRSGTTTDGIFTMIREIREDLSVPLVFLTYMNPIFTYGTDRFMATCREVGVDGVIVPDLPFEEKEEIEASCERYGIVPISLIAPTSCERIETIAKTAKGFLYCVSSLGVTGVRNQLDSKLEDMIAIARKNTHIPCAIGFGISTPQQAKELAAIADGVIVGSAIVRLVGTYGEDAVMPVKEYVSQMVKACKK